MGWQCTGTDISDGLIGLNGITFQKMCLVICRMW